MLKKKTLAVISLLVSHLALAGTMGPVCIPANANVPCETSLWEFGVQALYLQTLYSGTKSVELFQKVNNKWNLGFKAEGSYHYSLGSDVALNWTHYSSDTKQAGFEGFIPVPPFSAFSTLTNQNRLDQVEAVLGQQIDLGEALALHFYGGMQYANLQVNEVSYFPNQFIAELASFSPLQFLDNTDFKGFGPVLGLNYSYAIASALKITGQGAGSILYGTSRYSADYVATSSGLVLLSNYSAVKALVPTVQAKLGLTYDYPMAQGLMIIEGGYQAINYFNVLQTQPLQNIFNPITTNNYGLYGPYLGFKFLGNI